MLYRATRWKLSSQDLLAFKQGMVSLSRRRTFTKRLVKVDIPVPIVDQREVAFCYFTQIASIDLKRKNKWGYHLIHQKRNNFLAWLGMRANDSSATVVSEVSASTEISASTKYTTPNRLLIVSNENVSKINERMKILETTGDLELCKSLPSNNFRQMTKIIGIRFLFNMRLLVGQQVTSIY
ncbi:unnamed protein product [Macrosiphum euphorbiae]|uniref:Uncharacterized protein n=1 Tax=Macrosiphum euphorbiae TaxID=13131 RepID=A0AAV0X7J4_9HEMI|nr:unnamed protein product [Macrosiphum euphorbiae]